MKILALSLPVALLALAGCGAAMDTTDLDDVAAADELSADEDLSVAADEEPADEQPADEQLLGTAQQPLISTGGFGAGAKPWCAARKQCYDQCDRDYPGGGGPLSTCKQICDQTTASKCRPGLATGGLVIF